MDIQAIDVDSSAIDMRGALTTMTKRVPPSYQSWDVMKTRQFKSVAKRAVDALGGGVTSSKKLWPVVRDLRGFWA